MSNYDEEAFNEQLNENMADDPYGTATYLIREAVKGALSYDGTMNEFERSVLTTLIAVLDVADHG
jgi:hypothetical protein